MVGVGGFLGLGEKDVLVPMDRFHITMADGSSYKLVLDTTKAELEAAPTFDPKTMKSVD